jgi:hypothetical protein
MHTKHWLKIAACSAPALFWTDGQAADSFLDLRAGYTVVEDSYEGVRDDGVSRQNIDDDWDNSHRVFALLLWSPGLHPHGGWLFGVSAATAFRDTNEEDSDADLEYDSYAAHLNIGYGIPIGPIFQVELIPFIGFGSAKLERVLPGGTSTSDRETLIEWGANLNAVFTFAEHWQLGAQAGYLISDSAHEIREAPGTEVDYDFKQGNFLFSGFIGFRF